jgi:hypothetical protein
MIAKAETGNEVADTILRLGQWDSTTLAKNISAPAKTMSRMDCLRFR